MLIASTARPCMTYAKMGAYDRKRSGDIPPKITKQGVLEFIQAFSLRTGVYPTVDDIAEKLKRPRKVMADFLSRYARYGIVDAFKEQGQKTRYGPGVNWAKVDGLEWRDFFRAGVCPHCRHNGVLGVVSQRSIMYRCKWCRAEWKKNRDWLDQETWDEVERQAEKTKKQWTHTG
jgi:hypothetical protein